MWQSLQYETFIEVVPIDDKYDHYLGDECVCNPRVDRHNDELPIIIHNSFDKREETEARVWI